MLFLERGNLLEMLLFNCRTVHVTIEVQLNGLSYHSNTWFGVPRVVLVSFRTCIMESAQQTKHPNIFLEGQPPNSSRRLIDIMVFRSLEQPSMLKFVKSTARGRRSFVIFDGQLLLGGRCFLAICKMVIMSPIALMPNSCNNSFVNWERCFCCIL